MITWNEYKENNDLLEVYYIPFETKFEIAKVLFHEYKGNEFEDFEKTYIPILLSHITNIDIDTVFGELAFSHEAGETITNEISVFSDLIKHLIDDYAVRGELWKSAT